MQPVLFRIPFIGWDVPGYGLPLMLGFLLSVIWAARRAARSGGNPDVVLNCAFIALLGGVAGARFMHVVDYWYQFRPYSGLDLVWAIVDVRKGGLEVYGGVITALLGVIVYLLFWGHSVRWYLDIVAPSTALGMGLGRIGCFLSGCCWGTTCDLPWAVRFPFGSNAMIQQWQAGDPGLDLPKELIYFPPSGVSAEGQPAFPISREVLWVTDREIEEARAAAAAASRENAALQTQLAQAKSEPERAPLRQKLAVVQARRAAALANHADIREALDKSGLTLAQLKQLARQHWSLPVHPTQLYSTIGLVLLALLLNSVYWRRTRDGQVIFTLLLVEPWLRYFLELLRADNPVDTLGFTVSQKLAIALSATGLIGLLVLRSLPPRSPRARLWEPPPEDRPAKRGKPARAAGR